MHQKGLDIALVPAAALTHPVDCIGVGLLPRHRVEHPDLVAGAVQPQAQIGVLGDVPRVPGSRRAQHVGAEMIGGPAQGHGGAQSDEPGEHIGEP